jgi:hypothetical protein
MSVCLRPVLENWGESYTYSIPHDEIVSLLCEVAARAVAGETKQQEYGDLTVVVIEDGAKFLDFLSGGRDVLYAAKAEGRDNYGLTDNEIEAVDQKSRNGVSLASID